MRVDFVEILGSWSRVRRAARRTVSLDSVDKEPTSSWKTRLLLAEHSPIRRLWVSWVWKDLFDWVSKHFVRHKYGIEHFVSTQRPDRTKKGVHRSELSQESLVSHEVEANAQAIINVSRRRLCTTAAKETREAWIAFLETLKGLEPELAKCCVRDCVYRGFCYQIDPDRSKCGYFKTQKYQDELFEYRKVIEYEIDK